MLSNTEAPVGILCHGQLAMMTAEAGNELGIPTLALGPGENSPASYATEVVKGNYNDPEDVRKFSERVGSLVLDTDHVRTQVLRDLSDEGLLIVSDPDVISTIQNRIRLKTALNNGGVATTRWHPAYSRKEMFEAFDQ